jgi:hypothetical protein
VSGGDLHLFWAIGRPPTNGGYTLLWRKIWINLLLREPGKKISRLEASLYIINVQAASKDDEKTGLSREGSSPAP